MQSQFFQISHDTPKSLWTPWIERHHHAVFVLDEVGQVLAINSHGKQLLRRESGIRCGANGMLWMRGVAGLELQRTIAAAVSDKTRNEKLTHIERGSGQARLAVLMSAVADSTTSRHDQTSARPRLLVVLSDPDVCLRPTPELLAIELQITSREAEIASLLAGGLTLEMTAQRLAIRPATARAHLRSIFDKTGVRSQADLVRRALTGLATFVAVESRSTARDACWRDSQTSFSAHALADQLGAPRVDAFARLAT